MERTAVTTLRSARACGGGGGSYVARLQILPAGREQLQPWAINVPLAGDCGEIDRQVKLATMTDRAELLEALRAKSVRASGLHIRPEQVAAAAVVRMCDLSTHRDTGRKLLRAGMGRPEALMRRVWLPPRIGAAAVKFNTPVVLDQFGIGIVTVPGTDEEDLQRPVVALPMTPAESAMRTTLAVPVTDGTDAAHSIYVLLHPVGERQFIEDVLRPAA